MVWTQLITSKMRVKLLEHLFAHPDEKVYLRGLERTLNEPASPIRRELQKLEEMGLLHSAFEANVKYYTMDTTSQPYRQLRPLIIPVEPVEPVEPVMPVEPVEPVMPVGPVEPVMPVGPVEPEPEPEPVLVPVRRRASASWAWGAVGMVGVVVLMLTLMSVKQTQEQVAAVQQQLRAQAVAAARPVTVQMAAPSEPLPNESRSQRWRVMPGNWSAVAPAESGVRDAQSY